VEDFGSRANPTVLLVMERTQAVFWPPLFIERLLAAGYHVLRFDNRDIGLSTWIDWAKQPYTVLDMARDVIGLLDALGIERAHWVGVSMGGMISQQAALDRPERVRSLTSIMSSPSHPGDPELPGMEPKVQQAIDAMQSGALDPAEASVRPVASLAGSRAAFDEALFRTGFAAGQARGGFTPRARTASRSARLRRAASASRACASRRS
jgi:pimeloyl-ACP methyl ester carboxylesterase